MTTATSSAEPQKLFGYANTAEQINHHLLLQSRTLSSALQHFAASCTEYRTGIGPQLADKLRIYAQSSGSQDSWVRQVGLKFQQADGGGWRPASGRWFSQAAIALARSAGERLRGATNWVLRQGGHAAWGLRELGRIQSRTIGYVLHTARSVVGDVSRGVGRFVGSAVEQAQRWLVQAGNIANQIWHSFVHTLVVTAHVMRIALEQVLTVVRGLAGQLGRGVANVYSWLVFDAPQLRADIVKGFALVRRVIYPQLLAEVSQSATFYLQQNDRVIDKLFSLLLPKTDAGESFIDMNFDFALIVPLIEFSVPASMKGKIVRGMKITRTQDGIYSVEIRTKSGIGVREDLVRNEAYLKLMDKKLDHGVGVGVEVIPYTEVVETFTYNPKNLGDMTKMMGLMSAFGISIVPVSNNLLSSTVIRASNQNLSERRYIVGVEGHVDAEIGTLIADVGVEATDKASFEIISSRQGEIKIKQSLEMERGVEATVLTLAGGVKGKLEISRLIDIRSKKEQALIKLTIIGELGRGINIDEIKDILPDAILKDLSVRSTEYGSLIVEYNIDSPAEHIRDMMIPGKELQNIQSIKEDSEIYVDGIIGSKSELGGGFEQGGASQTVGVSGEMSVDAGMIVRLIHVPKSSSDVKSTHERE